MSETATPYGLYKGVARLGSLNFGTFSRWERSVFQHLRSKEPSLHKYFSQALVERDPPAVAVDGGPPVAALRVAADEDAQIDQDAAAALCWFLSEEMQNRYEMHGGRALIAALRCASQLHERHAAPLRDAELHAIKPTALDTMTSYCDRAVRLRAQLERQGRTYSEASVVDLLLGGLLRERPAWRGVVQFQQQLANQGSLSLEQLRANLSLAEISDPELAPEAEGAYEGAGLAVRGPRGQDSQELEAAVTSLASSVAAIQTQMLALAARFDTSSAEGAGPVCWGCGKRGHTRRNCKQPELRDAKDRAEARGVSLPVICASAGASEAASPEDKRIFWAADSGATEHMSAVGGGSDKPTIRPCRVRFGKRGSSAPVTGIGDHVFRGAAGTVVFTDVLHVPELDGNLFSVKAACEQGMSVQFTPACKGQPLRVEVSDARGKVVLTGTVGASGLYELDEAQTLPAVASALPHQVPAARAACTHSNAPIIGADEPAWLREAWAMHFRLGHMCFQRLAEMARNNVLGDCTVTAAQFLQAQNHHICRPCVEGKLRRRPHPRRSPHSSPRFNPRCLHMDLCQFPVAACGYGKARYMATFKYEPSGFARIVLIRHKHETAAVVRRVVAWIERQTGLPIQRVRSDRGGEYLSGELQSFFAERGIQTEPTAPYSPQSNGTAERHNGVIIGKVNPMLAGAGMGLGHWGDAAIYANDLHNVTPPKGLSTTPHESLLGHALDLSHFHTFGCTCWAHVPNTTLRHKLKPRARRGRFLGFAQPAGSGVYRVLLDNGQIVLSRTVVFEDLPTHLASELALPVTPTGPDDAAADDDEEEGTEVSPSQGPLDLAAGEEPMNAAAGEEVGEAVEVLDAAADAGIGEGFAPQAAPQFTPPQPGPAFEPTPPQTGPAPQAPQLAHDMASPAAQPRPTRVRNQPDFFVPRGCAPRARSATSTALTPIIEEGIRWWRRRGRRRRKRPPTMPGVRTPPAPTPRLGRLGMQPLRACVAKRAQQTETPRSVAEALSRSDAAEWQSAIDDEIASCLKFRVWTEVDLPPGKQALPSHFVFDRKRCGRYKARLVAGGHRQQYGLDYDETFAPTCAFRTLRMVLATCAHEDLELRQFDIRTAFLNADLDEEVYLRKPRGVDLGDPDKVLRLWRALYGLKQAQRSWNKTLEAGLRAKGFVQSNSDPALWILHGEGGAILAMIYVDDGLVAARTAAEADALVALIASMFETRVIGEPKDFVGIHIVRDRKARTIKVHQEDKARALAASAGVEGEVQRVPMSQEVYAGLRAATPGEPLADVDQFRSDVGTLLHLAQCTRPDIAVHVAAMACYSHAPTLAHRAALTDIIRYVGSTASRGITYGLSPEPLQTWCDSNFASCLDTRRSVTGYCAAMYGGAVSWASKKQATTAASTMEAEYQACGAVAREGLALLKALDELSLLTTDFPLAGPLTIFCDNKAALGLTKDRKEGQRVKHIDIIHHFARDRVASGELTFEYCRSEDNVSDCLTKSLPRPAFEKCLLGLGMLHD